MAVARRGLSPLGKNFVPVARVSGSSFVDNYDDDNENLFPLFNSIQKIKQAYVI